MSGIAGIFYRNGRPVEQEAIDKMVSRMKHRGPDGIYTWREGSVALGHCMMHTTPEAAYDNLPMESLDGNLTLTADARIDNRGELIRTLQLKPYRDAPLTDCDLILAAYQRWGKECPKHLLGAFAFAIWDRQERSLFCARDHFGVKQFYYYKDKEAFVFATEIKSVICGSGIRPSVDRIYIINILNSFYDDDGITPFKEINQLPKGNNLIIDRRGDRVLEYWSLSKPDVKYNYKKQDLIESFKIKFDTAVKRRARSREQVATMLSGGLDSSSITASVANLSKSNIYTGSCIFPKIPESDESKYIESVISFCPSIKSIIVNGTNKTSCDISTNLEIEKHFFDPVFSPNINVNYLVYDELKEKNCRVILDGYDGDSTISHGTGIKVELLNTNRFIEYVHYSMMLDNINLYESVLKGVKYLYRKNGIHKTLPHRAISRINSVVASGLNRVNYKDSIISDVALSETNWIKYRDRNKYKVREIETEQDVHFRTISRPVMSRSLEHIDVISSGLGVEVRFPFWDKDLIEFCLSVPPKLKVSEKGHTRLILREAMKSYLPDEIVWRKNKSNLSDAFIYTFTKHEGDRVQSFIEEGGSLRGVLDVDRFRKRFRGTSVCEMESSDLFLMWKVLSLHLWLDSL